MALVGSMYLVVAWRHRAPIVFADEQGYLGNARWLAGGKHWWMDSASFFRIGYPILLAPLFLLIDDPELTYRAALFVNVLLCAALAGLLYLIARRVGAAGHRGALVAALIGCAYPAIVVQTVIAWAEITAMVGVALLVLTAWMAVKRPRAATLVALASVVLFLDAVHGRFTLMIPVSLLFYGYLILARKDLRVAAVLSVIFLIAGWRVVGLVQRAAFRARWDAGSMQPIGVARMLAAWPSDIVGALVGQLWYLSAATAGLLVLGSAALVRALTAGESSNHTETPRQRHGRIDGRVSAIYVCALLGSVVVVSTLTIGAGVHVVAVKDYRVDYIFYGRYNEALVPTLVAVGAGSLFSARTRRQAAALLGVAAASTAVLGALSLAIRGGKSYVGPISGVTMVALKPFLGIGAGGMVRSVFVLRVTLGACVLTAVLAAVALVRPEAVAAVVLAAFISIAGKNALLTSNTDVAVPTYRELRARAPTVVAYDLNRRTDIGYYGLPFWLSHSNFVAFHESDGRWPTADLYVGPAQWPEAVARRLRLLAVDPLTNEGYWVPA